MDGIAPRAKVPLEEGIGMTDANDDSWLDKVASMDSEDGPPRGAHRIPATRKMVSNANTRDTGDALNSPEPRRRPLRSPKLSAKVRETLISHENKAQPTKNTPGTTVRPDGAPTLDGRISVAQRLLIDVGETRQNIKDLKLVIQQQTDMLVKLSTEPVSVK